MRKTENILVDVQGVEKNNNLKCSRLSKVKLNIDVLKTYTKTLFLRLYLLVAQSLKMTPVLANYKQKSYFDLLEHCLECLVWNTRNLKTKFSHELRNIWGTSQITCSLKYPQKKSHMDSSLEI